MTKRTIRISHREFESINEDMRKDVTKNVQQYTKSSGATKVARFVDRKPLEKCVLSQYGKFKKVFRKSELDEKYQRAMGKNVINYDMSKFRSCDVPLNMSVEEAYFNLYGKGFDGSDIPTMMHKFYKCNKCGLPINMEASVMPLECPRCRSLTPMGIMAKNKAYKRW